MKNSRIVSLDVLRGVALCGILPVNVLGITMWGFHNDIVLPLQWAWSVVWQRRFMYGPLEWVWRQITWWTRVPNLKSSHAHQTHTFAR